MLALFFPLLILFGTTAASVSMSTVTTNKQTKLLSPIVTVQTHRCVPHDGSEKTLSNQRGNQLRQHHLGLTRQIVPCFNFFNTIGKCNRGKYQHGLRGT